MHRMLKKSVKCYTCHILSVKPKIFSIFTFSCQILNFGEIQDDGQENDHV